MKVRAEVRFYGKVQQVFFRDYTRRFADRLGVKGWVMNCEDGSVLAVFEGEKADILELIRLLKEEHPYARVDHVDVKWREFTGEFNDFTIRYH